MLRSEQTLKPPAPPPHPEKKPYPSLKQYPGKDKDDHYPSGLTAVPGAAKATVNIRNAKPDEPLLPPPPKNPKSSQVYGPPEAPQKSVDTQALKAKILKSAGSTVDNYDAYDVAAPPRVKKSPLITNTHPIWQGVPSRNIEVPDLVKVIDMDKISDKDLPALVRKIKAMDADTIAMIDEFKALDSHGSHILRDAFKPYEVPKVYKNKFPRPTITYLGEYGALHDNPSIKLVPTKPTVIFTYEAADSGQRMNLILDKIAKLQKLGVCKSLSLSAGLGSALDATAPDNIRKYTDIPGLSVQNYGDYLPEINAVLEARYPEEAMANRKIVTLAEKGMGVFIGTPNHNQNEIMYIQLIDPAKTPNIHLVGNTFQSEVLKMDKEAILRNNERNNLGIEHEAFLISDPSRPTTRYWGSDFVENDFYTSNATIRAALDHTIEHKNSIL